MAKIKLLHISMQSSAFGPLEAATQIQGYGAAPNQVVVRCDLASAEVLLEVANRSCRTAVGDIKIAINLYKSRSQS